MPDNYQRHPAVKISIDMLKNGKFVENSEWMPNFIDTKFGRLYRVNIIGVIIKKNVIEKTFLVDDGTGTIISLFDMTMNDEIIKFQNMKEGQGVLIVGKPRKYKDDIYIAPEVINTVKDLTWMKVRGLEIKEQLRKGFFLGINPNNVNSDSKDDQKNETLSDLKTQNHPDNRSDDIKNESDTSPNTKSKESKIKYHISKSIKKNMIMKKR